jgi:hypothetical protein
MMSVMKSLLSVSCFLFCASCTMQRIPASVQQAEPLPSIEFDSCRWHAFPETSTSLLPLIQLIDCEVDSELDPEDVEFEFTHKEGEVFGKQSKILIEEVNLETNKYGANYYVRYVTEWGIDKLLGRWCCWKEDSDSKPTIEDLLPDELHAVHVTSDGGMVYRAWWEFGKQPRGLAIILCGLGGMSFSAETLGGTLVRDGWAVAYVYTVLNMPDYRSNVKLEGSNLAKAAIDVFNTKYCQVITATKAIQTRMEKQLPSLKHSPLVLIGISAGALNTPAIYNDMQGAVDAVVLIAGGANMFEIVQEGAFTNWKFTDDEENRFTASELQLIESEYLSIPSRDPYFLAPRLPHNKTLIVHAKWDAVVPAKNGDLLWERAGKPERWIYPSGHLGLFATFDWHAEDIVQWLDSKIN